MATKKGMARKVIIGGISGIVLGASSMATVGDAIIENIADDVQSSGEDYEDMSFGEAFATAREDLGPGETFEWHGNLYSTSTIEEWNAAHPSEPVVETVTDDTDATDVEAVEVIDDAEEELPSDEVEILGEEDAEDDIEVEVETGNDINGDEAAFVDLEEDMQTDAVEDVYVGPEADSICETPDYTNDDIPML